MLSSTFCNCGFDYGVDTRSLWIQERQGSSRKNWLVKLWGNHLVDVGLNYHAFLFFTHRNLAER